MFRSFRQHITGSPYQMINILTVGFIIMVFVYSAFFTPGISEYPVECTHRSAYGGECPSCGLSRSFSEMLRGDYLSAAIYNKSGPLIFLFFAAQLLMRLVAGTMIAVLPAGRGKKADSSGSPILLVVTDSLLSAGLFVVCFRHFLVFW